MSNKFFIVFCSVIMVSSLYQSFCLNHMKKDLFQARCELYELRARHQWPNLFPAYRPEDNRTPK